MNCRVLALVLVVACGGDGGTGPTIDQVLPDAAAAGATIEVLGARFCGAADGAAVADGVCAAPPSGFVQLGAGDEAARATVVSWADERITVTVPTAAAVGATSVVVTVDGVPSNAADFEVLGP